MLMHNGDLVNPTNKFVIELKKYTSKRKKTEADFEMMSKIEFLGGLYVNNGNVVVPADNFSAMLINAAKSERLGKIAKSGLFCSDHMILNYGKKKTPEQLFKDSSYVFKKAVKVQMAKVIRTRPIFNTWEGMVTIRYNASLINETQLDQWFSIAGEQIGLGDWRPQYGRFQIV